MGLCGIGAVLPGGATTFIGAVTGSHLTILEVPPSRRQKESGENANPTVKYAISLFVLGNIDPIYPSHLNSFPIGLGH